MGIKLTAQLLASKERIGSLRGTKLSNFSRTIHGSLQKHIRYNSLPLLTCIKYNIEVLIFCFLNIDIYCCASLYTHFDSGIRYTPILMIRRADDVTPAQEAETSFQCVAVSPPFQIFTTFKLNAEFGQFETFKNQNLQTVP